MTYLLIIIVIFYCILNYDLRGNIKNREKWFIFILFYLILVSGLSYRMGGDGIVYVWEYPMYTTNDGITWDALTRYPSRQPGWVLLVKMCKLITSDFWFFKLIHAIILNTLFLLGIKRLTNYVFTGILFYFVIIYFDLNFQLLRQSLAMGIFIYSLRFFKTKSWLKYFFWISIAISIHESALICLLLPIIRFIKINKWSMMAFSFVSVLILVFSESIIVSILSFYIPIGLQDKVVTYANEIEIGNRFNSYLNFLLSVIIPFLIVFMKRNDKEDESILKGTIFYGLSYSMGLVIPIFYRFSYFFQLLYLLVFVDLFISIAHSGLRFPHYYKLKNRKILKHGAQSRFIFVILFIAFLSFKSRVYLSPYGDTGMPNWVQYYPYSSVIFKNSPKLREEMIIKLSY